MDLSPTTIFVGFLVIVGLVIVTRSFNRAGYAPPPSEPVQVPDYFVDVDKVRRETIEAYRQMGGKR